MRNIFIYVTALFVVGFYSAGAESLLMKTAKEELQRSMTELKKEEKPPYFISYSIGDVNRTSIVASFGKIEVRDEDKKRILDIDLRVGDYKFDNTHIIRGASFSFGSGRTSVDLPMDDNVSAIKVAIWYATDRTYKKAIETYDKAATNKAVKVAEEDSSADFSHEPPTKYFGEPITLKVDTAYWADRMRKLSSIFVQYPWIFDGQVSFNAELLRKIIVTSEGTELEWWEPTVRVFISARTKADDGMNLPLYKSYFAYKPEDLPSEADMIKDLNEIVSTLKELKSAPVMTTFSGPAILSGEASGVFFHEIFGHRVEGHRQKDPNSSQTFKGYEGKKILPDFIDVVFDPSAKILNNKPLAGYYIYDDQGVKGQKVETVKDGIFEGFLMSRSPIEGFPNSNGHGRKQPGYSAVSRQSNLMVIAKKTKPVAELKELLREECKKQDKEFGLYFSVVQGGFTFTGRTVPNAFNVLPLLVYKVYADGRPDEIVRGVDLIGTPLTTFSNVIAAGDDVGIFNGVCGAESGGVPVSASSPSLLVSLIEAQKKAKSQAKPPILESPDTKTAR